MCKLLKKYSRESAKTPELGNRPTPSTSLIDELGVKPAMPLKNSAPCLALEWLGGQISSRSQFEQRTPQKGPVRQTALVNHYANLMRESSRRRFILAGLCVIAAYASDNGSSTCGPEVAGVRFTCPAGWSILNQDHAWPGEITIGDFSPSADERMKNVIPAGKNTITLLAKPALYASIDEWISATEHMASDEKDTTEAFPTESGTQITARCFPETRCSKSQEIRLASS